MKQVRLICNGDQGAGALANRLMPRLGEAVDVAVVDLESHVGDVALPSSLLASMRRFGSGCLPALVVDGVIVRQGRLPDEPEALRLIEQPEFDTGTGLELDALLDQVATGQATSTRCCGDDCC